MVRDSAALIEGNLVGTDIKATVDGCGIAADYFAASSEGQLDAERTFACGSRAQDGEDRRAQSYILKKARATAAARRINRPSCCGRVGSGIVSPEIRRVLVVEERHREKRRIGWIFGRQRLRRIGADQRVDRGLVERLDMRRFLHFDIGDRPVSMNIERDHDMPFMIIAACGTNQLRFTCATKRRSHGPKSTPLLSNWMSPWASPLLTRKQGSGDAQGLIQFDSKGVDFGPWLRRFVAQVKRNWFVPQAAMIMKGHVVITFNIHRNGTITDIEVKQPSHIESFNYAAFNALISFQSDPAAAGGISIRFGVLHGDVPLQRGPSLFPVGMSLPTRPQQLAC